MNLFKVNTLVIIGSLFCCFSSNSDIRKEPISVNVILTKALDMRCQFDYNFSSNSTTVECVNKKSDTCKRELKNLDYEYFFKWAQEVNKLEQKIYEFDQVDDGEFLKVSVNWEDSSKVLIIRNFPVYVYEKSDALSNISNQIDTLYKQLDSNRCW